MKNRLLIYIVHCSLVSAFVLPGCIQKEDEKNKEKTDTVVRMSGREEMEERLHHPPADAGPKENPYANAPVDVKTYANPEGGFGYDVYVHHSIYVHQPSIPAINGNRSFSSAADAKKTGDLVVYKIKNNIMPPSLTVAELDSIGVLK